MHAPVTGSQHAAGHAFGWHVLPSPRYTSNPHPCGPVIRQKPPNESQQAPIGHGLGKHTPPKKIDPSEHTGRVAIVHAPEPRLQQAPGQLAGLHAPGAHTPWHCACVVIVQLLSAAQQAPGHGFGSHTLRSPR